MAESKVSAEEVMMQLRYLQNIYSQQYQSLESEIATYTISNTSLQRNIELLQNSSSLGNSKILISGEGGAYFPAKLEKTETVMTYVGAGYLVEKKLVEATEYLRTNQKKNEEFLNKILSEKQRVEKELLDIAYKINSLQAQQGQE